MHKDVIVACAVPFMLESYPSEEEALDEIALDEGRRMQLRGVPLVMNHGDGIKTKYAPLGTVEASAVHKCHMYAWAALDEPTTEEQHLSAARLAAGEYGSVSLSHHKLERAPLELSLCERPRRTGADILLYAPSDARIARFVADARDGRGRELETMLERWGYVAPLRERGITSVSDDRYIETLSAIRDQRLIEALVRYKLMSSDDVSQASESAAPQQQQQQQQPAATPSPPPSQQQQQQQQPTSPPPPQQATPSQQQAAPPPPPPGLTDAAMPESAERLIAYAKAQQKATHAAQAEAAAMAERLAKYEAAEKAAAEKKAAEEAAKLARARDALLAAAPDAETRAAIEADFAGGQITSDFTARMHDLVSRASLSAAEKATAETTARLQREAVNSAVYDQAFASLTSADAAFTQAVSRKRAASFAPPTPSAKTTQSPASAFRAMTIDGVQQQQQQQQSPRSAADVYSYTQEPFSGETTTYVTRPLVDSTYPMREVYASHATPTRVPSHGLVASGRFTSQAIISRASDGTSGPTEVSLCHSRPAVLSMQTFAPDVYAKARESLSNAEPIFSGDWPTPEPPTFTRAL